MVIEALEQGMDPQPLETLECVAVADLIPQLLVGRAVGLLGHQGFAKRHLVAQATAGIGVASFSWSTRQQRGEVRSGHCPQRGCLSGHLWRCP